MSDNGKVALVTGAGIGRAGLPLEANVHDVDGDEDAAHRPRVMPIAST